MIKNIGITAAALLLSTIALGASPEYVDVDSISYAGSGCPAGSVAETLSLDYAGIEIRFDDFMAEAGPYTSFRDKRKSCTINIDLNYPQGWQFTIGSVEYRGYVSLDRGVTATQKSTYYFQGQNASGSLQSTFRGPYDDDYHFMDSIGYFSAVWSPCGASRAMNITTQVRVDNRRNRYGDGLMTLDSISGSAVHNYGLKWRRCW